MHPTVIHESTHFFILLIATLLPEITRPSQEIFRTKKINNSWSAADQVQWSLAFTRFLFIYTVTLITWHSVTDTQSLIGLCQYDNNKKHFSHISLRSYKPINTIPMRVYHLVNECLSRKIHIEQKTVENEWMPKNWKSDRRLLYGCLNPLMLTMWLPRYTDWGCDAWPHSKSSVVLFILNLCKINRFLCDEIFYLRQKAQKIFVIWVHHYGKYENESWD